MGYIATLRVHSVVLLGRRCGTSHGTSAGATVGQPATSPTGRWAWRLGSRFFTPAGTAHAPLPKEFGWLRTPASRRQVSPPRTAATPHALTYRNEDRAWWRSILVSGERLGGRKGSLPRRDQLLVRCVLGGLVVSTPRSGYIAFGAVTGAEGAAVRLPGVRPATPVSTEGWAAPGTVVLLGVTVRLAEPTWSSEVVRTIRERPAQEATGEVAARWVRATSAARAARPTTW